MNDAEAIALQSRASARHTSCKRIAGLSLSAFASQLPVGCGPLIRAADQGALAQLVERLICIQEVSGSTPLGSTIALHEVKCGTSGK